MLRGLIALAVLVFLWSVWAEAGGGVNIGRSHLMPGGEVGYYFACTYLAARQTFEVNYTEAVLYREDEATFFEKRRDCPTFAHESQAIPGWRHE